jgi:putative peptidoglycan lipid II flippase
MSRPLKINDMSLGRASLILAGMIFLSRLAGFGRNLMTAQFYGTGPEASAFNAAFAIPETLSIVIAGGALATGFVPTFSALLQEGKHDEARDTFRALLTLLFGAVGAFTLVLVGLTYTPLLSFLAPTNAPASLYFENLRILLLAQFFFILGGVFTGAFNSLRWFWLPALQPVFFNVGIIILGVWGRRLHPGNDAAAVLWQSYGAVVGAVVGSILLQVPAAWRAGLSIRPIIDWHDPGVRKVLAALIPIFLGLASGRILSLQLPVQVAAITGGGENAITNASRLAILPLELIASGSAIAIFPTLSQLAARGELEDVRKQLSGVLRRILKLLCIATLGLIVAAFPLVHILFKHGKFSSADASLTAQVLMVTALSLPALGAQQLLARGFFALNDNRTPVIAGLGAMLLFGFLAVLFSSLHAGALGITAASVIAVSVLAAVLWKALEKRLGKL